jgi:alkyl hydroperoxide reductase subunit F
MTYDLIIIGGGPAGAAAAVYAARKQLKTLLISPDFGGQSIVSEGIQNWIGTITISGQELAQNLKKHVEHYSGESVTVKEGEKVISVKKDGNIFTVSTDQNNEYRTKTVLAAAGSKRRRLEAAGAERLEHKGLTYCASCDGPLFSGMDVVVIGGGNAGLETAAQLLAYANSVTLINRSGSFRADEVTVKKVLSNPKIKAILNAQILEVKGDKFVDGLAYKDIKTGETHELKVAGIFVEIGQMPNTDFVKDMVELDEYNRIKIDPWTQKTSAPGIWAAGDSTNIRYHQNNIAAGDGVKAVEDIYVTLHTK